MKTTVSIIIPLYNAEEKIEKAIESVINQTYTDIEIILVNDGSTDEGYKYINRFLETDDRIIYKSVGINKGVSSARNIGIESATGKYIMFLDSDDWLEKTAVEDLKEEIEKNRVDFVSANYILEGEKSILLRHFDITAKLNDEETITDYINSILSNNLFSKYYYALPRTIHGKMYKKSIIDKYNIRFKEEIRISEDMIFNIEYLKRVKNMKFLQKYLVHINTKGETIKKSYIENLEEDMFSSIIFVRELIDFKLRKDILDKYEVTDFNKYAAAYTYFLIDRLKILYFQNIDKKERNLGIKEKMYELGTFSKKIKFQEAMRTLEGKIREDVKKEDIRFLRMLQVAGFFREFRDSFNKKNKNKATQSKK